MPALSHRHPAEPPVVAPVAVSPTPSFEPTPPPVDWWPASVGPVNRSSASLDVRLNQTDEPAAIAYPHAASIAASLGRPIADHAAVAPSECRRRGVEAFTEGDTVSFASDSPPLHVAAHEAVHWLQHGGWTRDAGLGAEGHASLVADTVAEGRRAGALIGDAGDPVTGVAHNYERIEHNKQTVDLFVGTGQDLDVSDDGKMAVGKDNETLYADIGLIMGSAAGLYKNDSTLSLEVDTETDPIEGVPPSRSGDESAGEELLFKVKPSIVVDRFTADGSEVDNHELTWADCGRTAREIMGPFDLDAPPVGVFKRGDALAETKNGDKAPGSLLVEMLRRGGLADNPLGRDDQSMLDWYEMTKTATSENLGLNRHAAPGLGEAYSIVPHEKTDGKANFHWGAVIMSSGGDRVTLENFAGTGDAYDTKDVGWSIRMYGTDPKRGQTFADYWEKEYFGERATTIRARPRGRSK